MFTIPPLAYAALKIGLQPFMLGLLIDAECYFIIQLFWRWHVIRSRNARQKKQLQKRGL
jgi:hypothetical protein